MAVRKLAVLICILSVICASGCKKQNTLPKEMMHKGKPIDPAIVIATQFGDSSHLEPKKVCFISDTKKLRGRPGKVERTFDTKKKLVTHKVIDGILNTYKNYDYYSDCYQYIGSYNGKHIVLVSFDDTRARGSFSYLGTITRDGDYIQHYDTIAGGDGGWGGGLQVVISQRWNITLQL